MIENEDMALKWIDETVVRYAEFIHREHGGTGSLFESRRFDRFLLILLVVVILFFCRLQMLLLSWSTGVFFSLIGSLLSIMLTLIELFVVNVIEGLLGMKPLRIREKLIADIKIYAGEPVNA